MDADRLLAQPDAPSVIVLSGPSGAGKSTLIDAVLAREPTLVESISATTRDPRPGERDGVDYHFTDESSFLADVQAGRFLEHARVFARHCYGTPRAPVAAHLAAGRSVIMDVDVQGARQVRSAMPEAVLVFVAPPSRAVLEERLRGRATEAEEAVVRRLAEAETELAAIAEFDYLVVNDHLPAAIDHLMAIIAAEGRRTRRLQAAAAVAERQA